MNDGTSNRIARASQTVVDMGLYSLELRTLLELSVFPTCRYSDCNPVMTSMVKNTLYFKRPNWQT